MTRLTLILLLVASVAVAQPPIPVATPPKSLIQWQNNGDLIDYGSCTIQPVTSNGVPYGLVVYQGASWAALALTNKDGSVFAYLTKNWRQPSPPVLPKHIYLMQSTNGTDWQTFAEFTNPVTGERLLRWKIDTQP